MILSISAENRNRHWKKYFNYNLKGLFIYDSLYIKLKEKLKNSGALNKNIVTKLKPC